MRVLILGATGMLGHKLWFSLSENHEVIGTFRENDLGLLAFCDNSRKLIGNIDVWDQLSVKSIIQNIKPDAVINCIGIIKQLDTAKEYKTSIYINSLLPHLLAQWCGDAEARLIHISTDCVFKGDKGNYLETDESDAADLYGKSKYLGEVSYKHAITIRTSIIGHELATHKSLIDWFLTASGTLKGFKKAIYSGFSTNTFAEIIDRYILLNSDLFGLYHVSSDPINKYDLLELVNQTYKKNADIKIDTDFFMERSLNCDRFKKTTGFAPKSWGIMIKEMHDDYEKHKDLYVSVR